MPVLMEQAERRDCWQADYWLRHCEGYRVFAADDPLGYVEKVVLGEDDEPAALEVRVGEVFTHCLTVAIQAVDGVDPGGERVFVAPLADLGSEAFGRQLAIPAVV